eukprot:Skav235778  [mRNA]  locus=scaffold1891:18516:22578:- [translate_table: standard]
MAARVRSNREYVLSCLLDSFADCLPLAILILLGPALVRCIRQQHGFQGSDHAADQQNLTDFGRLTDLTSVESWSSMGDLCSKFMLLSGSSSSGMVFGCQPSIICEEKEGLCGLKPEQELLVGFRESKAKVLAAARAYKDDQVQSLAHLSDYVKSLFAVSLYSEAAQDDGEELLALVNASIWDLGHAAFHIMDKIQAGLVVSKRWCWLLSGFCLPAALYSEAAAATKKWDAAMKEEGREPSCKDLQSAKCGERLLKAYAPMAFKTVTKLYTEIELKDWTPGRDTMGHPDRPRAETLAVRKVVQGVKAWIGCEAEKFAALATLLVHGLVMPLMARLTDATFPVMWYPRWPAEIFRITRCRHAMPLPDDRSDDIGAT